MEVKVSMGCDSVGLHLSVAGLGILGWIYRIRRIYTQAMFKSWGWMLSKAQSP